MRKKISMKSKFVGMPKSSYDALTFKELDIGDRFIGLPVPGDNCGYSGFRIAHYVFIKIKNDYRDAAGNLIDNAFRRFERKALHSFPEGMPVIKIED